MGSPVWSMTRVVHLEKVRSLETDSFINALRRFMVLILWVHTNWAYAKLMQSLCKAWRAETKNELLIVWLRRKPGTHLTTFLFLVNSCATLWLPSSVFADKKTSSNRRGRQTRVIVNQVWSRLVREYLPSVITHKKWKQSTYTVMACKLVRVIDWEDQKRRLSLCLYYENLSWERRHSLWT